jgi:hypothetical protein
VLVRFDSKAGALTTFGEVAVKLLRMMGQSGSIPGAILARDIPAAVQRLRQALGQQGEEPAQQAAGEDDERVSLRNRAFPLIELLERAARTDADVIWDQEGKR